MVNSPLCVSTLSRCSADRATGDALKRLATRAMGRALDSGWEVGSPIVNASVMVPGTVYRDGYGLANDLFEYDPVAARVVPAV